MKKLKKSIEGASCEIYSVVHHQRLPVGSAVPLIEIYDDPVEVPLLNEGTGVKHMMFSIIICPDPEMDRMMTKELLQGLTSFDLSMMLPRKDDVLVPVKLYDISSVELESHRWVFEVTDQKTVDMLMEL